MNYDYLSFEKPIAELQAKIDELSSVDADSSININDEIENLRTKSNKLTEKIYSKLNSWQVCQVARHPLRPYTLDYIKHVFTDFEELHGDRLVPAVAERCAACGLPAVPRRRGYDG